MTTGTFSPPTLLLSFAAIAAVGCGGSAAGPAAPGEGDLVTTVSSAGVSIGMGVDADGDVDVILLQASPLAIEIDRAAGSTTTQVDVSTVDFTDFLSNDETGFGVGATALVGDHAAYFVGLLGVTVVPFDGSASRHFTARDLGPDASTGAVAAYDGGDVYLCYETEPPTFGRYDADGTWTSLFTAGPGEECYGQAIAVDADAVYFPTTESVYRWSKSDGRVTTVVEARDPGNPYMFELAVSGDWLVGYDGANGEAFWKVPKTGTTLLADAIPLVTQAPTDPFVYSLVADATDVYLLSQIRLLRVDATDGTSTVLAERPDPPGSFWKLAVDASHVYFGNEVPDDAGSFSCELRDVAP